MRTIAALLAMPLGALGFGLSLAVTVAVWWAAFDINRRVDRVAGRVDQGFARTDDALERLHEKLRATRTATALIRRSSAALLEAKLDTPALRARVDSLSQELTPLLERAETLADSLRTLATLFRTGADVLGEFGASETRSDRMREAANRIESASEILADVQGQAAKLRETAVNPRAQALIKLIDDTGPGLDRLTEGLDTVRSQVDETRNEIATSAQMLRHRIFQAAGVSTVLIVWIGLGQLCLVGWGRRNLSRSTS